MARIFISYKRADKKKVFEIKDQIESSLGEKCWIDLDGIECDAQFKEIIIKAINECEVVLFMYSKAHSNIMDFENDWTVRELHFASKKKKRIVFVNIDGSTLTDEFEFDFGIKQQIDAQDNEKLQKLINDLKKWLSHSDNVNINKNIDTIEQSLQHHRYVDLGLPSGTLWATCNVGASKPSDYGDYFAWGETSTKKSYDYDNVKYYLRENSSDDSMFSKYCTDSDYGTVDNRTRLELSDDAARSNWGGSWRMPTVEEWEELENNCDWKWTKEDGHFGYKVTGKNGKSIFLPAAGWRNGDSQYDVGVIGGYWSSSVHTDESFNAFDCHFNSDGVYPSIWDDRCLGLSVRPVVSSLR